MELCREIREVTKLSVPVRIIHSPEKKFNQAVKTSVCVDCESLRPLAGALPGHSVPLRLAKMYVCGQCTGITMNGTVIHCPNLQEWSCKREIRHWNLYCTWLEAEITHTNFLLEAWKSTFIDTV